AGRRGHGAERLRADPRRGHGHPAARDGHRPPARAARPRLRRPSRDPPSAGDQSGEGRQHGARARVSGRPPRCAGRVGVDRRRDRAPDALRGFSTAHADGGDGDGPDVSGRPPDGTAYVYMTGRFFGGRSQIVDGRPFLFAFGDAAGRIRITAVPIPGTPAYESSRRWPSRPPNGPITIVGLRTLHLPALFAPGGGRIEVVLCPVFRITPGMVRGSSTPAPTARFELIPVGGAPPGDGDGARSPERRPARRPAARRSLKTRMRAGGVPKARATKPRGRTRLRLRGPQGRPRRRA